MALRSQVVRRRRVVVAIAGWPAVFAVNLPEVVLALALQRHEADEAVTDDVASVAAPPTGDRVRNRVFVGAFVAQAGATFALYTLILVVPLVLDDRDWGAGAIGVAVAALTIGSMLMGPVGGRFGDVRGRRRAAECGLVVAIVALATAARRERGAGSHHALAPRR